MIYPDAMHSDRLPASLSNGVRCAGYSLFLISFSGVIDDVLVYKEALSEDEIGQIYAGYVTPSENNKVPFEDDLLSFTDTVTVFLNDEPISDTIHVVEIDVKLKFHQLHNHLHLEIM